MGFSGKSVLQIHVTKTPYVPFCIAAYQAGGHNVWYCSSPICRTLHFPVSLSAHASSLLRFFWMAACYAAATTSPPSLVLPTNLFRVHSLSHRLSWVGKDLKGSVCPTPVSTKDHLKIRFFVWMLSVCFLNSVKFSAMTTSLGSLFQYPTILTVKNLFLISLST